MNEKILVNDNAIQVNAMVDQAKEAAKVINSRLIPALEAIGQDITDAVLKDCLTGGNATKKKYFISVEADTAGTKTPGIKRKLEETANEAWERFEQELTFVRREARNHKHLTIVNGVCTLTPENQEKLADTCRIYLTNPKEIAAWNLQCEICDRLNQLFKRNAPLQWSMLFQIDENGFFHRNHLTDYSKLV